MFISSCQAGQNVQHWVCQPLVGGVHPWRSRNSSRKRCYPSASAQNAGALGTIRALDMYCTSTENGPRQSP